MLSGQRFGKTRYSALVVPHNPPSKLDVVATSGDRQPDVDRGEVRLVGEEFDVGIDEVSQGVGAAMLGVGVNRVDRLPNHGDDGFLFGGEEVVEAAGPNRGPVTDRLDGRAFEALLGDE